MSRDAYYKYFRRESGKAKREGQVIKLVKAERQKLPRIGGRKLYAHLSETLRQRQIKYGRDRFVRLLAKKKLLVQRRRKYQKTTYSKHQYAVSPNLLKEKLPQGQILVADITYIRIRGGFRYLFLVTDLTHRKILGYSVRADLSHRGAIQAMRMAKPYISRGAIHHSDRGCQYCCHEFLKYLRHHGIRSSMTDENHCYQNAVAERINGILKDEFYLDRLFPNEILVHKAVANAIKSYNAIRPHWSLNLKTPDEAFQLQAA